MHAKPYLKVKRILDVFFSIIALIPLFPFFLIVAAAIKIESKGPAIFRQTRCGKNKKPFEMYKFRTMYTNSPQNAPTYLLKEPDQHITKMGKALRRNSLDELPQLWNILLGEMSFVGPRPVVLNEHDLIAERDRYGANEIRPGLTGLAQINGRDKVTTLTKAQIDGMYVKSMCFKNDLICFLKTIPVVLKSDGFAEGCINAQAQHNTTAMDEPN